VRKEIKKSIEVDQDTFVRELRNLSLLAHISHPNLIELFCAYEYRGNFNFIFAMAEGGTLSDLLLGKTQIPVFAGSVGTMLFALADLASAIQVLHNFTVRVLDLQLSGCHHDLAPRNILIRGKTFLLADFGLSSFRSVDETSLTSFKEVGGSYVAPECQKLQEGRLQTQKITKASDIWSFGCIITEAFTYSILGADGVRRFREQRKHEVTEDITWYRFFRGIDAPSPEVKRWIQSLSSTADPSLKLTVELVENMLSMDPQARPGAVEVLERLRCVALLSSAKTVHVRYDLAVRESPQFDLQLEEIRFRSWIIVFEGIARTASGPIQPPRENTQFEYDILTQTFQQTELYLSDLVTGSSDANTRTIFLLQEQNTKLINAISDTFQRQVNTHVEQMILEEVNIDVSRCEHLTSEGISNSNIGTLISVKHMLSLERKGLLSEHQDILLQQDEIKIKEEIDHHSLATFRSNGQSILVEWLRYSTPWVDEVTGRQLRDRVGSIARLLHAADESRLPGTLRCYGFFPQASRKGFGFVYELKSEKATSPRPITLNQLYDPNHKSLKPSLESRVELACKITQALYKLHSVSWLHRNLHPSNVIFLMDNDTRMGKFVRNPYLLGFTASRQNVADAATIGPSAILDYHHPEYLEDKKQRYREEFDYYSVGILLLEIGHWNSLPRITSSGKFSGLKPELFRKEILKTMVSPIARTMGSKYEQVVRVCLESRFNDAHFHFHETAHMSVLEDFKRKVVDLLQEILDGLTVKS
jgi:serine/threonine protein kinase